MSQTRMPNTHPLFLFLGLSLTAFSIVGCNLPPRRALVPDPMPLARVLLFTDNTPGSLLLANAYLSAARRTGSEVVVKTSASDFIMALPSESWRYAVVVTRYAPEEPSYAGALRSFAEAGGTAHIVRWRDDPASPSPPDAVVYSPIVIQVWLNGSTTTAYGHCPEEKSAKSSIGYTFAGFHDVQLGATRVLPTGTALPITAGTHAAQTSPPAPPPPS